MSGPSRTVALVFLVAAGIARAQVVQVDVRSLFNADVVVNNGAGTLDPTQDPVDHGAISSGNFCFPTQSVAVQLAIGLTPDGIPDDAFFPADAFHPDVTLWWRNDDDGLNARRAADVQDIFTVDIPPGRYGEVHLFANVGDGTSPFTMTLLYDDGATSSFADTVPDWFDDPVPTSDRYLLIDGRDRLQPGSGPGTPYAYEDSNDPAIFGFRTLADPAKTLTGLTVDRSAATSVFDFFGLVAVSSAQPARPDLYEARLAQGLLMPANIVQFGVTSPLDHAPASGPRLYYFVDDLAGFPALIRVAKGGLGLQFTF